MSLFSSAEKKGKVVTQIITTVNGVTKTFEGVLTETIVQSKFTHFETKDGRLIFINDNNVLFVEIFSEDNSKNDRK